ncbi:MAG: bestrophin family ion channel [Bacteroidota bacterium]
MYIQRNFNLKQVWQFSGNHILKLLAWSTFVAAIFYIGAIEWLKIPWLPLSLIGTAVAFYVGFKNNNSYGRMWEARKIWGAIVNSSRAWGSYVKAFISDQFTEDSYTEDELYFIKKRLIYRHIAWLYSLRSQLLIPTPWEHSKQEGFVGMVTRKRREELGVGLMDDEVTEVELKKLLVTEEYKELIQYQNTATQLIDKQSGELADLKEKGLIDSFRHMELQQILQDFYIHQGKCERIKKFPLPRQYGGMSIIFVQIFIFLLPFGMISEFAKLGEWGILLAIPFTVLVSWVYLVMELVGDYSENPFQGLGNDIPMLSLCRTIEIDLREMLGEKELPPAIQAKDSVLM